MLDEMDRLRECGKLFLLLCHYFDLGKEDRHIWQDRLLDFEELQGRELTRLYGELVAHGWLEQNTGLTPILEFGRHAACYRITTTGQRAVKEIRKGLREQQLEEVTSLA